MRSPPRCSVRLPSLVEYVLVSQEPRIEIFRRTPAATWEYLEVREGNVSLASGPTLDVSMLYADLPLLKRICARECVGSDA